MCQGQLNVSAAQLGLLDLGGTTVTVDPAGVAVDANVLTTTRSVVMNRSFKAIGSVRFIGAVIGGQLNLRTGHFRSGGTKASVSLHEATTSRAVYLRDATFEGRVNLSGARVGGRIDARHSTISATPGLMLAIDLNGTSVERSIQLSHSTVNGTLRLHGARIGTQLILAESKVTGLAGRAPSGDTGIQANPKLTGVAVWSSGTRFGSIDLERATLRGDLLLTDTEIAGRLTADGMTVERAPSVLGPSGPRTPRVDLEGTTIRGVLRWTRISARAATLRFFHVDVGRLEDDPDSWNAREVDLAGFRYDALPLDERGWDLDERLKWLKRQTPFSRQPYNQFASYLALAGRPDDGRKVGLQREEERRRRGTLTGPSESVQLDGQGLQRPRLPARAGPVLPGAGHRVWASSSTPAPSTTAPSRRRRGARGRPRVSTPS